MKKIFALFIIAAVAFSVTGCEMDENSMGMLLSFMGGLTGNTGTAFNGSGGAEAKQWGQIGSQMSGMWMSQSENNKDGRDMSAMLQANQSAYNFSMSLNNQNKTTNSTPTKTTDSKSTDTKSTEKKSNWDKLVDKGQDKLQDPKTIELLGEKLSNYQDKK